MMSGSARLGQSSPSPCDPPTPAKKRGRRSTRYVFAVSFKYIDCCPQLSILLGKWRGKDRARLIPGSCVLGNV